MHRCELLSFTTGSLAAHRGWPGQNGIVRPTVLAPSRTNQHGHLPHLNACYASPCRLLGFPLLRPASKLRLARPCLGLSLSYSKTTAPGAGFLVAQRLVSAAWIQQRCSSLGAHVNCCYGTSLMPFKMWTTFTGTCACLSTPTPVNSMRFTLDARILLLVDLAMQAHCLWPCSEGTTQPFVRCLAFLPETDWLFWA